MEKNVGTYTMDFVSHHNQHKQFAPFGRRTGLSAGRCFGRYVTRMNLQRGVDRSVTALKYRRGETG